MTPVQPNTAATGTMDEVLERIAQYSAASNLTLLCTTETGTEVAPVNQVQADTATSVASSITISARKASSTTSLANTLQSRKKESRTDVPKPVALNVMKKVLGKIL